MPKFLDVIEPTKSQKARGIIALIIFQSDLAASIDTVLVIPCRDPAANLDLSKLTPQLEIGNQSLLAMVPQMAGVSKLELSAVVIGTAVLIRDDLIAALDLLVTGF
jgi:hypothetical protein